MRGVLFALVLAFGSALAVPLAGAWQLRDAYVQAQPQKGGNGQAEQRGERGRDARADRRDDRRDRMTEDERRALQRDLEKANRELYGPRPQK